MNNTLHASSRLSPSVVLIMLLSLFYWSYLGLTSQVIIVYDSIGYENLGRFIASHPWKDYFTNGLNREPLYPLLISWSMRLAGPQGDYLPVQILIQVAIFFLTQWLAAVLLKRLRISDGIAAAVIAYMGFSPGFINTGLILFSEILTLPLVLWLVLSAAKAWTDIHTAPLKRIIINASALAAAALAVTFIKAIFEIIVPLLLAPYLLLLLKKETRRQTGIFLLAFALIFGVPVTIYKTLNKIYNGVYALTDRGAYALYGNTAPRTEPTSTASIKASAAFIPGADVCMRLCGADACAQWGFLKVDMTASRKMAEMSKKSLSAQQLNDAMLKDSLGAALHNPPQYAFFTFMQAMRIFSWEAPETFCLVYPQAVGAFYNHPWLRYPLRIVMILASLAGLLWGIKRNFSGWKKFLQKPDERTSLEFYAVTTIIIYTALYAIFYITSRYAIPIAPLFLALIACLAQDLRNKKS